MRTDIDALRTKVLQMMQDNEEAPELERLDRHEFNMDVEERQKYLNEQNKILQEEHFNIEMENTAMQFQHYMIKRQCWDDMVVKVPSYNNNPFPDCGILSDRLLEINGLTIMNIKKTHKFHIHRVGS